MKKFTSLILLLVSLFIGTIASARNTTSSMDFNIDFSNVRMIIPSDNVDWNFYNKWYLASATKVDTSSFAGWNGVPLETVSQGPYIDKNSADGNSVSVLHVGLTNNYGSSFTPETPAHCKVTLKEGGTLYVYGILHVPGNNQVPYIEGLDCVLKN